jgi:MFS family permease
MPFTAGSTGRRGLLGSRDFVLLWAGQSVSDLGTAVTMVVLPLIAVTTLQASAFEVGALASVEWLPWLLVGLPAGAWVDRWRRRPLLVVCDLARAVLLASIPLAAAIGVLTLGQLFVVAFLTGVCTVFFQVGYQVYLPVLVGPEHLVEGNAKLQGTQSIAQVGGPGLGGLLAQLLSAPFALAADAASYLVSVATLLAIRTAEPVRPGPAQDRSLRREIAEGARYVLGDPLLRVLTLAPALANLFLTGVGALTVLFLVRSVHLQPGAVGLLVAAGSLGSVIGALAARALGRRLGTARALWLVSALTAPFGLLIPLTGPGWRQLLFVAGMLVPMAGILVYNVTAVAWRQAYCPPQILGRVVASMRFVLFGTVPLGALLGGALASAVGVRDALWLLLAGNLSSPAVLAGSRLRRSRDLPERAIHATGSGGL